MVDPYKAFPENHDTTKNIDILARVVAIVIFTFFAVFTFLLTNALLHYTSGHVVDVVKFLLS
jgi:hypothetical protein